MAGSSRVRLARVRISCRARIFENRPRSPSAPLQVPQDAGRDARPARPSMAPFGSSQRQSQANGKNEKKKRVNEQPERTEQRLLAQKEVIERKLAKIKAAKTLDHQPRAEAHRRGRLAHPDDVRQDHRARRRDGARWRAARRASQAARPAAVRRAPGLPGRPGQAQSGARRGAASLKARSLGRLRRALRCGTGGA